MLILLYFTFLTNSNIFFFCNLDLNTLKYPSIAFVYVDMEHKFLI